MGFIRWLIVLGVILVSALSFGNVTPAGKVYYTTTRDDLLAAASDLSLPSGPTRANEPFLYFHIGPVRSDFFALSMAKTDARQFAEVADEAIKKGFGTSSMSNTRRNGACSFLTQTSRRVGGFSCQLAEL